ncbi:DNA-binding MarR family transcriptional regulator [Sediminihabitans luteus]|uniref:DNA-binding MarR family transcriptional regulator n=1 Tax=Sediminihabitans luteus TaxID=1138585 RepID=A0A2M9CDE3_9CELL|nr:MarR family transcriptional regulator [Sediminihabitans luteus]PJJ69898.1 DNA-binding MarR family transcriptional regulator [Sediminihabitans luteus]GII99218.1 MarR family transcriptional regulator [Sediminihabitans luteus]
MTIASGNDHGTGTDGARHRADRADRADRDADAASASAAATLRAVELEVTLLLRRADQATRTQAVTGLDRSAYLVLHVLDEHGPLSVTAIADLLGLDGSTVTRQVIALERAGHATRRRDDADRRVVLVAPSADGLAALARHRTARAELYDRVLTDWSDDDRAHLAELLHRLNQDIDTHRGEAGRP